MVSAAASIPNLAGTVVDDRYELIQKLGSGSYGVVYKAIDLTDGIFVAVKVMNLAGRSDADRKVIKREIELHHIVGDTKGVVGFTDLVFDADYCYIVLEFCRGGDLFEHATEKGSYAGNDKLLRKAVLSLVDAVQAIHDAGVAHRDLKPENILANEDGSELYLADFGLATNEKMSTDFGRGTSIYMSPECIGDMTAKQPYNTYLSDIWSLGVVLVNMITGSQPWSKATIQDACFRQFLMDPDFLYKALPFSKEAHAIIQSMFHLDPTKRISLRALRAAILSLDTFFRPMSQRGYVVREHEHPTSGLAASGRGLESTTEASEIDIPCAASEPGVRVARNCSAGSAVDGMAQLGFSDSSSCSSSRASSGVSSPEKVITPEGTTTTTISISKAINEWERMMVDACAKEVRGDHDWQNGSVARMLMTQYRERCSF